MEKTIINSFAGGVPLEIVSTQHRDLGPLVSLIQSAGSVHFQHSITPSQAREMAAALIAHADALEA
jgi:hypothetical protein